VFLVGSAVVLTGQTTARLADTEFWRLVTTLSEQTGEFPIANLVTNEESYPDNAARINSTGGAYIGVGPEQNFSFIAALQPEIAFIVDLRRPNRTLHLLYKALFERAPDRAAFNALLFPASEEAYQANLEAVTGLLTLTHGFAIPQNEQQELAETYRQFFEGGPGIRYTAATNALGQPIPGGGLARNALSFEQVMAFTDSTGMARSFLSTEQRYQVVRNAHLNNLIVPVVGNFAGATALRGIANYLSERGIPVSVFYGSNVQDYLTSQQRRVYCANLIALPQDAGALFLSNPIYRSTTLRVYIDNCRRNL
jgi:hypothetical protein